MIEAMFVIFKENKYVFGACGYSFIFAQNPLDHGFNQI